MNKKINNLRDLSWQHLYQADRTLEVPFQLQMDDSDIPFICEEIIRVIPGRRLVAFGTWGDKPTVAKFFYDKNHAKRHIKRELLGIEALLSSGIPTPKLFFQGSADKQRIQVLLFEKILHSHNLDSLWKEKKSSAEIIPLMHAVTVELATQHVLGVVQRDLHLKNFLIMENHIYTLDGGSIKKHDGILPKEPSLDHLALFLAQLGVGTENLQEELFATYLKARGWIYKKSDLEMLRIATNQWVQKRWINYRKKIQRNSTTFAKVKTSRSLVMYEREYQSPELMHYLQNPELIFQRSDTQILKAGRTSTVAKFKMNERNFVVKRYNIKNMFHGLRRCLRSTRAAKSWELSQRLQLMGIPTAKPVAFIENRILGFRGKSYFIMEFVEGPHIGQFFEKYHGQNNHILAEKVQRLFLNLFNLNLTHGDLKKTNILINQMHPIIIDLDGMIHHWTEIGLRMAYRKELSRFMKNWENYPSVREMFVANFKRSSPLPNLRKF